MKNFFALCLTVLILSMPFYLISGCAKSGSSNSDGDVIPVEPLEPNIYIRINQVEAVTDCAGGSTRVSAYVSVVDENGELVENLTSANFEVSEGSTFPSFNFSTEGDVVSEPISTTIIMDYSDSIFNSEENMIAMENAVLEFIDGMGASDRAEIIKFNSEIRLNTGFTNIKSVLEEAVYTEVPSGTTYFYDALCRGVTDVDAESNSRKAVIALSDGGESHGGTAPQCDIDDVISSAQDKGVPLFIVGLVTDENYEDWLDEMLRMTDETEGQFFQTNTSNNLSSIYTNISNLINVGQYLIQFDSTASAVANAFSINVTNGNLSDSAGSTFPAECP